MFALFHVTAETHQWFRDYTGLFIRSYQFEYVYFLFNMSSSYTFPELHLLTKVKQNKKLNILDFFALCLSCSPFLFHRICTVLCPLKNF